MSRDRLGRCEVPSLPYGHAIRGLYGPLALQWLKTMQTGSAFLHRWSAALEEYDFTVKHRPGKAQTHVDGLSRLPVDPAPPEDVLLQIRLVENEDEARNPARELHSTTHLGGQALWKLFCDRYEFKAGRRIYLEVAQSCPQCQLGSDYGHCQKTTGAIQSQGPWDTLSIDIVGPLPADLRQEFLIVFVDCYSRYTILVPSSNHTANMVSEALLRLVIPYFGTPCRLLSDRGREFISEIWTKLLRSLGIQRVLTSPYHPEGNANDERSHRTLNNMLRAHLLEGSSSKAWVEKVPGIMLTLNAMPHEPHGFSASMIATGREPTLPPDVHLDAHASPAVDDPSEYVEAITQRLQLTHQQMASPSPPPVANPYQVGSLIYALTTPPERASKLLPRWKDPYRDCHIPNDYQVIYEDGEVKRTILINHAEPERFTAPDLPEPVLSRNIPPSPWVSTGRPCQTLSSSSCSSRHSTSYSAPAPAAPQLAPAAPAESAMQPPANAAANQRPEPAPHPRRSPRLNPEPGQVCAIKSPPESPHHHTSEPSRMARTYPLTVTYNKCLGSRANPLSFANLRIADLRNGQSQCLSTIKQLIDALPKTEDPSSRFALHGHIASPGQKRLQSSMRAAIWWLLPSDGIFLRASNSLQYFLTLQGRRVVLRGGDVAYPLYNSHLNWIPDPSPPPSRDHGDLTSPAPSRDHGIPTSSKENTPPQSAPRKLPRKIRPRRRKERQSGSTANHNSPSWKARRETQCEPASKKNSPSREAGREMQPRSTKITIHLPGRLGISLE